MMQRLVTTKVTPLALTLIRSIAAATGEKQFEVRDRLFKKKQSASLLPVERK